MVTLERSVFRNLKKKTNMTVMVELVFQAQSQCKKTCCFVLTVYKQPKYFVQSMFANSY